MAGQFYILFAFLTSFIIVIYSLPYILKLAENNNLFDNVKPRGEHKTRIPTLGGTAIFASVIFSISFWADFTSSPGLQYLVAGILILFYIGIKDDLIPMSALTKLLGQILAASVLVLGGKVRILSLYGLFGIENLSYSVSVSLSVAFMVLLINAYNFIDGIDGLASGIGLIGSLVYGFIFYSANMKNFSIESFALAGALAGFLIFNFHPAKILMGDTGSLIIGLIMAQLSIRLIGLKELPQELEFPNRIIFILAVICVPFLDTIRVVLFRIFNRKNPLQPDRSHIHHFLTDAGFHHGRACAILYSFNIAVICFTYFNRNADIHYTLTIIMISWILFSGYAFYFRNKQHGVQGFFGKKSTTH